MPSFWPFTKTDPSSTASFEKTLSTLSQKIARTSASNDNLRQRQRRYKVLWTLYTSFAYILIALILTLVTGWKTWRTAEWSTITASPVVIYAVRAALDAGFDYRIANSQNSLNELYKQREVTIEKLKAATKYNSTQQLLDKYGGTPQREKRAVSPKAGKRKSGAQSGFSAPVGGRTGFAPPATANIPGRPVAAVPAGAPLNQSSPPPQQLRPLISHTINPSEEFAPNAFTTPSLPTRPSSTVAPNQYANPSSPKWYDRILDIVLGEDETQAKNRIVLICKECRLVNGQAPPGATTAEEVGRWRCGGCGAWNGVESEEGKILKAVGGDRLERGEDGMRSGAAGLDEAETVSLAPQQAHDDDNDDTEDIGAGEVAEVDDTAEEASIDATSPASSTRSKARQRNLT